MAKIPYYEEEITLDGAALGLTKAIVDRHKNQNPSALVCVADNAIAWLATGKTPTASTKTQLSSGDYITLDGYEMMSKFKAIKTAAGNAALGVQYFYEG